MSCTGSATVCNLGYIALVSGICRCLTPQPRRLLVAMEPRSQSLAPDQQVCWPPMLCKLVTAFSDSSTWFLSCQGKVMHMNGSRMYGNAQTDVLDGRSNNEVRSNANNRRPLLMEPGTFNSLSFLMKTRKGPAPPLLGLGGCSVTCFSVNHEETTMSLSAIHPSASAKQTRINWGPLFGRCRHRRLKLDRLCRGQ